MRIKIHVFRTINTFKIILSSILNQLPQQQQNVMRILKMHDIRANNTFKIMSSSIHVVSNHDDKKTKHKYLLQNLMLINRNVTMYIISQQCWYLSDDKSIIYSSIIYLAVKYCMVLVLLINNKQQTKENNTIFFLYYIDMKY